jgi:hypothetical protein
MGISTNEDIFHVLDRFYEIDKRENRKIRTEKIKLSQ